nr:glutathione binding-like protein [Rhizobium sp. CFBP 8762]
MASRISFYEAGADNDVIFHQVNVQTKQLIADASDYRTINASGQVPALRLADGTILTENFSILTFLADAYPAAGIGPTTAPEKYKLAQWLSFVSTELHKQVFTPLLSTVSNDGAKAFARQSAAERFTRLNRHLHNRNYLLEHFSVADAYLVVVLNWAQFVDIDLRLFATVNDYLTRLNARPSVARALAEEMELMAAENARQQTAE